MKSDDFIHMVADEICCMSKWRLTTVILESYSVYPPIPFDKVLLLKLMVSRITVVLALRIAYGRDSSIFWTNELTVDVDER